MATADIIQIVIGILSLLATVAVSFAIYWLQSRHEKEIQRADAKREQKDLEEKAHVFLSENSSERDYLPWCIVAANLHRHEKHTRDIYTNFCRCSSELQSEILKQAGFTLQIIKGRDWVDTCFKELDNDREKYKLGRDYLYDGAKYFHRGFERYRGLPYRLDELRATDVIYHSPLKAEFIDNKYDFINYFDRYFECMVGELDIKELGQEKPIPPADYIWNSQDLGGAEEEVVCYWMIEYVLEVVLNIYNRFCGGLEGIMFENSTDAQAETFEDKYYETLLWMYYTYYEPKAIADKTAQPEGKKHRFLKGKKLKNKDTK